MIVKLSEIAEYSKGQQINGDELITNGEFDYLNGGINPSGKLNDSNVCGNTVTISEGGNSSGYVNYMEKPFWCGAHCYYLYNVKGNSKYLYYALKSQQDRIMGLRSGACMPNIKKSDLGKFELIYSFDDEEQTHITSVLDKVTDLIAKHKRQLELLDEIVRARFVEMFGRIENVPNKWRIEPLLNLGKCKNGINFQRDEKGIEIRCLGVRDFKNLSKITNTSTLPNISLNEMPSDDYMLKNGDIVFVRSNGNKALVGRCLAIYPNDIPTTFSGFCIRFRVNDNSITVPYLIQVLKTESMRKMMLGRGANIQNLNQKILSTLNIPVPPLDLQQQFADFVWQNDKSKAQVQKSLEQLEMLKKALMQEYFG